MIDGNENEDFEDGFMFALFVAESMGFQLNIDALAERLRDIVSGKMTLIPSAADAIASIEKDAGKRLPDNLRESTRKALSNRADLDKANKLRAITVMRMMGVGMES
ncbi:MAG TPA: hypothetical protein VGN12_16925 [Pirellulales bacterium]|jgi:hypothetical protein